MPPRHTFIHIAAGDGTRWRNHLGVPKHLAPVHGEPVLHRTVRQLRHHNPDATTIIVGPPDDPRYKPPGTHLEPPRLTPANGDADKFLSSAHLWNPGGRTTVIYGDIYLTDQAAETIATGQPDDWTLYCTFQGRGECFAQTFLPHHQQEHRQALDHIVDLYRRRIIDRNGGWEHYRAMNGVTGKAVRKHRTLKRHIDIGDGITCDLDYPDDYTDLMRKLR